MVVKNTTRDLTKFIEYFHCCQCIFKVIVKVIRSSAKANTLIGGVGYVAWVCTVDIDIPVKLVDSFAISGSKHKLNRMGLIGRPCLTPF